MTKLGDLSLDTTLLPQWATVMDPGALYMPVQSMLLENLILKQKILFQTFKITSESLIFSSRDRPERNRNVGVSILMFCDFKLKKDYYLQS